MNLKRLTSFLCAAALAVSYFTGFTISVSADGLTKNVTVAVDVGDTAVKITSGEEEELTGVLIHAKYAGNVLEAVKVSSEFTTPQESADIGFAYAEGDKLFMWNSLSEMVPYKVTVKPKTGGEPDDTREDITGDETASVSISASSQTAPSTLTAQIFAGEKQLAASDFTYVWSRNGSPVSGGENGTLEDAPAGAYTVVATVKSDNVSYKGSTAASQAVTIKAVYTVTWSVDGATTQESYAEGETPSYSGTPSKAQTDTDTFEFTGWNPVIAPVTGDITYTAQFGSSKRSYTVAYNKNEGTIENEANYTSYTCGTGLTLPIPTKNGYTFRGWYESSDFSGEAVTTIGADAYGDKVYYAKWEQNAPDTFTITWKNEDGTTIKTTQAASGTVPVFDGTTPTKTETAQYTYTFAGWTPTVVEATANTEYTATFTPSLRSYTITWQNDDESEIDHETLEYGATPSHAAPSKTNPNNDGYTYTFTGWSPAIVNVVGDQIYRATFGSEAKQFDVTYTTTHGTAPTNVKYTYGVGIADLPKLTDDSYNLLGWYSDEARTQEVKSIGTSDFGAKTLYAKWQANTPDINVDFENEKLKGFGSGEYTIDGEAVSPDAQGKLDADGYIGKTISIVKKATLPDIDSEAQSLTVDARPAAPTGIAAVKRSVSQADGQITGVTTDMEYKLSTDNTWTQVTTTSITGLDHGTYYVRKAATETAFASKNATVTVETQGLATVIFKNDDGTQLKSISVAAGETPSYDGETPTKASTAEYTYTFAGWTPALAAVEEGHDSYIYTATYTETKNKYTITWVDEDGSTELYKDENVEYGKVTPTHDNPSKANTAEFTYEFTGWTPTVAETVTGDATYKATYSGTKNKYKITWVVAGKDNKEEDVEYGATPEYGETPTRAATAEYIYTFKAWSPEITAVSKAQTYTATWNEIKNKYTVTWKNADGTVLETDENVEYGSTPTYDGATPTKASTDSTDYTFNTWTPAVGAIEGDTTYTAIYTESVRKYDVTFNLNYENAPVAEVKAVDYNTAVTKPSAPEREGYTFAGWFTSAESGDEFDFNTAITAATQLYAHWTEDTVAVSYTVVPALADGTVIGDMVFKQDTDVEAGTEVTADKLPIVVKGTGTDYYVLADDEAASFKKTFTLGTEAEQTLKVTYKADPSIVVFSEENKGVTNPNSVVDTENASSGKAFQMTNNYARIIKYADYPTIVKGNTYELSAGITAKSGAAHFKLKDSWSSATGVNDISGTTSWTCEVGKVFTDIFTIPATDPSGGTDGVYLCKNGGMSIDIDYIIIREVPAYTIKAVTPTGDDIAAITTGITKLTTEVRGLPHVVKGEDNKYYVLTDEGITTGTHTKVFDEPVTSEADVVKVEYTLDDSIIAYAEGEDMGAGTASNFTNANKNYSGGNSGAVKNTEFYTFDGTYNETTVYNLELATVNRASKDIMLKATASGSRIKIKEFVSGVEQTAADKMNITTDGDYVGALSKDIKLDYTTNGISQRTLGLRSPNNGDITPISDYVIIREALSVSIVQDGTNINAAVTPAAATADATYKWEEKNADGTYTEIGTTSSIPFADNNGKTVRLTVTRKDGKYAESNISNTTADYLVGITGAFDTDNSKYIWSFGNTAKATTKGTEIASATNGNEYADLSVYLGAGDSISNSVIWTGRGTFDSSSISANGDRYLLVTPAMSGTLNIAGTYNSTSNGGVRIYYYEYDAATTIDTTKIVKDTDSSNNATNKGSIASVDKSGSRTISASLAMTAGKKYVLTTYREGATFTSMTFTPTTE